MSLGWSSLTFTPSDDAVKQLREAWSWLLPEPIVPVLFSALGDAFFEAPVGGIWWLNTGTAETRRVADSVTQFRSLLAEEQAEVWFMPGLVERLHASGKIPGPGQCFTYVTLPIFKEGTYDVSNLNPVDGGEHFAATGQLHQQIHELPDGARVKLHIGS